MEVNRLERTLSLGGSIGLIVGMVIGASIFVLIPSLAGMTGPSLYLAYAVSVVPNIFAALYLIQLGGVMPVTGANYFAVTRLISPTAGFVSSVAAVVGMICTNCLVARGFAEYLGRLMPGLPVTVTAIGVVVVFGIINWIGVRIFQWFQVIMMVMLVAGMLIFGAGGLFHLQPEYQAPLFPNGIGKFIVVVAIATFSWSGFVALTEVAGEVKNPRRNIPLAIIISLLLILFLYVVQTYAFTGTIRWDEAARIGPTALIVAAERFLPSWVVTFVVVSALFAMGTTINAIMLMAAREALAWSRDHVIPLVFNRIGRFKTPEVLLLAMTLLSAAGVLFTANLESYAIMVVFALMVSQGLGAVAVWRMPRLMPELYRHGFFRFGKPLQHLTMAGCMVFFTGIFAFGWVADRKTGIVFMGIMAAGLCYWFARKRYLEKKGILLHSLLNNISSEVMLEMMEGDEGSSGSRFNYSKKE
ncbi:MAG: APC family permease [Spirochaetes bacterium]|nr:APC family permease [Spirochaetota bacterium]